MEFKRKVLAYITKGEEPNCEILVFEHKDNPEAGLQVPGGQSKMMSFHGCTLPRN